MKKIVSLILLILLSLKSFEQSKASLTKEETINYINKKLKETESIEFNYDFYVRYRQYPKDEGYNTKRMYILYNSLQLRSDGKVVHTDKVASSLAGCYQESYYYGSKKTEVSFNPNHITSVDILTTSDSRIGQIKLSFLANTARWEKHKYEYKIHKDIKKKVYSHNDFWGNPVYYDDVKTTYNCDDTWSSTNIPTGDVIIYFFKSDPENGNKLVKAFNHLISLYKAEDDPFGD